MPYPSRLVERDTGIHVQFSVGSLLKDIVCRPRSAVDVVHLVSHTKECMLPLSYL
jgi:hypothetical protein